MNSIHRENGQEAENQDVFEGMSRRKEGSRITFRNPLACPSFVIERATERRTDLILPHYRITYSNWPFSVVHACIAVGILENLRILKANCIRLITCATRNEKKKKKMWKSRKQNMFSSLFHAGRNPVSRNNEISIFQSWWMKMHDTERRWIDKSLMI